MPNVLLQQVIGEFIPRYLAGGEILHREDEQFRRRARSSIIIRCHSKGVKHLPAVIIMHRVKSQIVLVDLINHQGIIDESRRRKLEEMLCTEGMSLVFVSALNREVNSRKSGPCGRPLFGVPMSQVI